MPAFKMLSMAAVAAMVMGVAEAFPHPECEECAKVTDAQQESLDLSEKYLCCDLSCATEPVAGCGIFGLPLVCKACYDGDDTPAYDDPPLDGDTTPSPVTDEETATRSPVSPEPATTPSPVSPQPVTPAATPEPVAAPVATPEPVMSYDFDDDGNMGCTACDDAEMMLTEEDWAVLEMDELELVCDADCLVDLEAGCGAFGLPDECRAVPIDFVEPAPTPSPVTATVITASPTEVTMGDGEGEGGETTTSMTGEGEGEGGETTTSMTGEGEGEGEETTTSMTGEGEGEGEGTTGSSSCTAQEIATCADLSQAQVEALASYDNGGKVVVCDPTCDDGSGNSSHCNYFGLGMRCRGCGPCSDCPPCP